MTTLHIQNTVRDYDSWQQAFDKYEQFRADNLVRSYRICRQVGDPHQVTVDLDFASTEDAEAFMPMLEKIWSTPQSKQHLVSHSAPALMELVRERALEPSAT
jgi:hypothetical protein